MYRQLSDLRHLFFSLSYLFPTFNKSDVVRPLPPPTHLRSVPSLFRQVREYFPFLTQAMNAAKPILQRTVPPALLPPFLLDEKVYDSLAEVPLLHEDVSSPSCM